MTFKTIADLPAEIQAALPVEAQIIFLSAFNHATHDKGWEEDRALVYAWEEIVNRGYRLGSDGVWKRDENSYFKNIDRQNVAILAGISITDQVTQNLEGEFEIQIAWLGHLVQGNKEFDLTPEDFADAVKNFDASQNPLAIDYEHSTFVEGAKAPAAGWAKKIIDKGAEGLFAVVSWTKSAAEAIRAGEYKFISPVFLFRSRDTKTGENIGTKLGPLGLTNFPLIDGMEPLTAKYKTSPETGKEKETMKEFLIKLLAKIGVDYDENMEPDKVIELIVAKTAPGSDGQKALAAVMTALDLTGPASVDEIKGKILALKHPGNTVPAEELAQARAELLAKDIETSVDGAIADGKGTPAERDWLLGMAKENLATFKSFVANRPKVVPIASKLPEKKTETGIKIDDVQATINKQLGVSDEVFAKYNTTEAA